MSGCTVFPVVVIESDKEFWFCHGSPGYDSILGKVDHEFCGLTTVGGREALRWGGSEV